MLALFLTLGSAAVVLALAGTAVPRGRAEDWMMQASATLGLVAFLAFALLLFP